MTGCVNLRNTITYAKRSGLRSMQNISGVEREIVEAHKNELTHDIWGNPDKLREWVKNKINQLINKNYSSKLLDKESVDKSRNELVKAWGELLKQNIRTSRNPFLQLKILKSITENLSSENKSLAPIIKKDVFEEAAAIVEKTGRAFKKVYIDLLKKTKYNNIGIKEETVELGNVRGIWYHLKTLNPSEAVKTPKIAQKQQEFIINISQGSDWCIRNKHNLSREYIGTNFHIFVDDKGIPQLCLTEADSEKLFRYVKGREQYKPIKPEYKTVLRSFLQNRNICDAQVLDNEGFTHHILSYIV